MVTSKPFKEIAPLVASLKQRGLQIVDDAAAETYLRKVGYFRSGGYRYLFRELLPEAQQDASLRQFRSDIYTQGASLRQVQDIEEFDARLRIAIMQGLMDFEVRLRAAMAHTLARRHEAAHADANYLDATECAKTVQSGETKFEAWETTYQAAISGSREEDFIAHELIKYGKPLATWVAVEVLSFGSLPYLYELMLVDDRREVARAFGVKQEARFAAWMRALVDLRNYCAHGARLFNRLTKRPVKVTPHSYDLGHLDHLLAPNFTPTPEPARRVYPLVALLAYMLQRHEAGSKWSGTFKTCMGKLPNIVLPGITDPLVTPEQNMGFPTGWKALPLWS